MIFDLLHRSDDARILTSQDLLAELGGWSGGAAAASGVRVDAQTALRFSAVFASVRVLAEAVGQLPAHLFERKDGGRQKATEHPLYTLLHDAPNDWMTAQEWREQIVAHLALRGNHYAYINRSPSTGRVYEILPFASPDAVTPKYLVDDAGRLQGVVYQVRFANGNTDVLPAEQVLHIPLLTLDGLNGLSPIAYARETIGLGIAMERHGAKLFANGATPRVVLESDQKLGPEAKKNIRESWERIHQGVDNAHRTAVLELGLKAKALGLSAEDAQFLESRKFTRSEIAGIFRVPPHMIGDLERATFTNIEHQGQSFIDYSLMPYLTRIEARVSLRLLAAKDRGRYFAKFNVASLLRGDMKSRAEFYTRQVQNGALSPNEIREFEDMNPRDGGNIYLTPSNMLIDGKPPPAPESGGA